MRSFRNPPYGQTSGQPAQNPIDEQLRLTCVCFLAELSLTHEVFEITLIWQTEIVRVHEVSKSP